MSSFRLTKEEAALLMMKHRCTLYGYIYACVRSHSDAEDIFQDVSVVAMQEISQLKNSDGFLPWSREIAFRRVLAHHKKKKSKREVFLNPHIAGALADAAERTQKTDATLSRREALMECLEQLPQQSRELIDLRYDESTESVAEIAQHYGQTVRAVYCRLDRIKNLLRNCVTKRLQSEASS
ncbi:hypothetical protein MNBD_PLANCTO02-2436 [hydrothermal vent metagenome]|uniref:Uncharacterized protein n=1 Tax=hydrothermal vent metagenome TaxID=652676 RepID=A0A3B1DIY7_9ZZZZ